MNSRPDAGPEREQTVQRLFSNWRSMSAEEWVARYSHTVGCSDFDEYQYSDAELDQWIQKTHKIMKCLADVTVEQCRTRHLTRQEIEAIESSEF